MQSKSVHISFVLLLEQLQHGSCAVYSCDWRIIVKKWENDSISIKVIHVHSCNYTLITNCMYKSAYLYLYTNLQGEIKGVIEFITSDKTIGGQSYFLASFGMVQHREKESMFDTNSRSIREDCWKREIWVGNDKVSWQLRSKKKLHKITQILVQRMWVAKIIKILHWNLQLQVEQS